MNARRAEGLSDVAVIPAQAGIQRLRPALKNRIPACARMATLFALSVFLGIPGAAAA